MEALDFGSEPGEPGGVTVTPVCSTSGSGSTRTEGLMEQFPDLPPSYPENRTSEYRCTQYQAIQSSALMLR